MAMELLRGVRVIEVSSTPRAGFCGKMFIDAGAEVIKLSLPTPPGAPPLSKWLDRGKSSVVLDWRAKEGEALVSRVLETADILVSDRECDGPSQVLGRMAARCQRLIHVSTSNLGHEGPFADRPSTDLMVAALSGICHVNGSAGALPLREPGNQASIVAGIAAYLGALAALIDRTRTDRGQSVKVSALEAMVNVLGPYLLQCSYQETGPARRASATNFLFDCADGKVSIMTYRQLAWDTILSVWGIELTPEDAQALSTQQGRNQHMGDIRRVLAPVVSKKTRAEIFEDLCSVRIPCGMVMAPGELASDPHLMERQSFDQVLSGGQSCGIFPGPAFRLAGERSGADRSLPAVGAQTAAFVSMAGNMEVAG